MFEVQQFSLELFNKKISKTLIFSPCKPQVFRTFLKIPNVTKLII